MRDFNDPFRIFAAPSNGLLGETEVVSSDFNAKVDARQTLCQAQSALKHVLDESSDELDLATLLKMIKEDSGAGATKFSGEIEEESCVTPHSGRRVQTQSIYSAPTSQSETHLSSEAVHWLAGFEGGNPSVEPIPALTEPAQEGEPAQCVAARHLRPTHQMNAEVLENLRLEDYPGAINGTPVTRGVAQMKEGGVMQQTRLVPANASISPSSASAPLKSQALDHAPLTPSSMQSVANRMIALADLPDGLLATDTGITTPPKTQRVETSTRATAQSLSQTAQASSHNVVQEKMLSDAELATLGALLEMLAETIDMPDSTDAGQFAQDDFSTHSLDGVRNNKARRAAAQDQATPPTPDGSVVFDEETEQELFDALFGDFEQSAEQVDEPDEESIGWDLQQEDWDESYEEDDGFDPDGWISEDELAQWEFEEVDTDDGTEILEMPELATEQTNDAEGVETKSLHTTDFSSTIQTSTMNDQDEEDPLDRLTSDRAHEPADSAIYAAEMSFASGLQMLPARDPAPAEVPEARNPREESPTHQTVSGSNEHQHEPAAVPIANPQNPLGLLYLPVVTGGRDRFWRLRNTWSKALKKMRKQTPGKDEDPVLSQLDAREEAERDRETDDEHPLP